jgi:hypothetical protein
MFAPYTHRPDRTDRDDHPPTLSTDWRGVALACHVAAGRATPDRHADALPREVAA